MYGNGSPIRLFVAGLHGDEWRDTSTLLLNINTKPPKSGTLVVIPIVDDGEYISTLDEHYYTTLGSKIIDVVKNCVKSDDFVKHLEDKFPLQAKKAIENYKRFVFV